MFIYWRGIIKINLCCVLMSWGQNEIWLPCFLFVCHECLLLLFANYEIFLCWFRVYFSANVGLFSCMLHRNKPKTNRLLLICFSLSFYTTFDKLWKYDVYCYCRAVMTDPRHCTLCDIIHEPSRRFVIDRVSFLTSKSQVGNLTFTTKC